MTSMRDAMRRAGIEVPKEPERSDSMPRRPQRGRANQGNRPNRGRAGSQQRPSFPDSYFATDEQNQKYLLSDFVSRKVDTLARQFANDHPQLTTSQLRRFFNHCRDIERRIEVEGESWERVSARFSMLRVHAQNANAGRGDSKKIPDGFRTFIDENVARVEAADNQKEAFLDGFLPHFEALVGFGARYFRN